MFKNLWQLLMLYLVLGATPGEGEGDKGAGGDAEGGEGSDAGGEGAESSDDDTLPGDDLDSLIETVEGDDKGPKDQDGKGRENAAIRDARKRAQDAEEARIRAEATLEAERRMRSTQQPTEDQRLYEQEEARLKDSEVTDLEKWQIRSNRTLRNVTQNANRTMAQAADLQDRSAFERLEITNPKVYKLYAAKVEKAKADMNAKGQDAPRLALLRFLIGNDVMDGKLKSGTTRKAAAAAAAGETRGVDRGRSPGARSDVSGKGRMSDADKRKERLKGVII